MRAPQAVLSEPGRCRCLDSPGDLVLHQSELRVILMLDRVFMDSCSSLKVLWGCLCVEEKQLLLLELEGSRRNLLFMLQIVVLFKLSFSSSCSF